MSETIQWDILLKQAEERGLQKGYHEGYEKAHTDHLAEVERLRQENAVMRKALIRICEMHGIDSPIMLTQFATNDKETTADLSVLAIGKSDEKLRQENTALKKGYQRNQEALFKISTTLFPDWEFVTPSLTAGNVIRHVAALTKALDEATVVPSYDYHVLIHGGIKHEHGEQGRDYSKLSPVSRILCERVLDGKKEPYRIIPDDEGGL